MMSQATAHSITRTISKAIRHTLSQRLRSLTMGVMAATLGLSAAHAQQPAFQLAPVIGAAVGGAVDPSGFAAAGNGDGGLGIYATVDSGPLRFDAAGNLYHLDKGCVRRVDASTGVIQTVAGQCGQSGFAGDGGPATAALLSATDIAVDSHGNIYITDYYNNALREVEAATGIIQSVLAYEAAPLPNFTSPESVVIDANDRVYVRERAQFGTQQIIRLVAGVTTVVAGSGGANAGDPSLAINFQLPILGASLAVDGNGDLYFGDSDDHRVYKITVATGKIVAIAGTKYVSGSSDGGGDPLQATFGSPLKLALNAAGDLFIGDILARQVMKLSAANGRLSRYAGRLEPGDHTPGNESATGTAINITYGMAVDPGGHLYLSNYEENWIDRIYSSDHIMFPFANGRQIVHESIVFTAQISAAISSVTASRSQDGVQEFTVSGLTGCVADGVTIVPAGATCTAEVELSLMGAGLRRATLDVTTSTGNVSRFGLQANGVAAAQVGILPSQAVIVAGLGPTHAGYLQNGNSMDTGLAITAPTSSPYGVAVDNSGNVYFADTGNHVVRRIDTNGFISTVAGNGSAAYAGDNGPATSASLNHPTYLAIDSAQSLYIADSGNHAIRRMTLPSGKITTLAGNGSAGFVDNVPASQAQLSNPHGMAFDLAGNLYFSDTGNHRIRILELESGMVRTFIGTGFAAPFSAFSFTQALQTNLGSPNGLAIDGSGNLFFADPAHFVIGELPAGSSSVRTYTGLGQAGSFGDNSFRREAAYNGMTALATNAAGDLYISDTGNNAVRKVERGGALYLLLGLETGFGHFTPGFGAGGKSTWATGLSSPTGLAFDAQQNLYVADTGNNVIRKVFPAPGVMQMPATSPGSSSADQTIIVENIGTAPLSFATPYASLADTISSTNFSLDPTVATTCGVAPPFAPPDAAATVASGSHCALTAAFHPTTDGFILGRIDLADNAPSGTQAIYLLGGVADAVSLAPGTLPAASDGVEYTAAITATGGVPPLALTTSGAFPNGITASIAGSVLTLAGKPSDTAAATFTVTATDLTGQSASVTYTITPAAGGAAVVIQISEAIRITDGVVVTPSAQIGVVESIHVSDAVAVMPSAQIGVVESIQVSDAVRTIRTAGITLGNLTQVYNGTPRSVTASTSPAGLGTVITYNNSTAAPTAAGSYQVAASISDPAYTGSQTGTLIVQKAAASVTLSGLARTYSGAPISITATTTPANLAVTTLYGGSPTPPTTVGSYSVTSTISDSNYAGSGSGTLVISAAPAGVVQLGTTFAFSRTAAGYKTVVTVTNSGTAAAQNVQITAAALGAATAGVPVSLGAIAANGGSAQATFNFPASAGAPGSQTVAKFTGSYTGGTFGGSIRVTLP